MDQLNLSAPVERYFSDLYLCCTCSSNIDNNTSSNNTSASNNSINNTDNDDDDNDECVTALKATELFRSANIPSDILKQITDLSFPHSSSPLTNINRVQFYSALKLIAAHQANMAIRPDILTTAIDLPLPRFMWNLNYETPNPDLIQLSTSPTVSTDKEQNVHKRNKSFSSYEPIRVSLNSSDIDIPHSVANQHDGNEIQSTDSEVESETISVSQQSEMSHTLRGKNGSPWSTGSESPTPTNSVAEQRAQGSLHPGPWGPNTATGRWPATSIGEEHTQLLGTEEESSDRHSSDEETGESTSTSVWRVGPEQRQHYISQFHQLHPDSRGLISGSTARLFFEKSRLPVSDLRKIWLLSDVTKDGALCVEEFITAMHLVVLRRNEIPVPDVLPIWLVPRIKKKSTSSTTEEVVTSNLVDLGSNTNISMICDYGSSKSNSNDNLDTFDGIMKSMTLDDRSPSLSPPVTEPPVRHKPEPLPGNKEWTKFIDSPTSSIASPGPKPVNFDFHKASVERDPKIFHPVPLRVTPESSTLPIQHNDSGGTSPRKLEELAYNFQENHDIASPKKLSAQLSCDISSLPSIQAATAADIKPIQRPQARKSLTKNIGAIPPPPTKDNSSSIDDNNSGPMSLQYAPKKEPPPPPPPRPHRTHTRSSSLDLNRFKNSNHVSSSGAPPQVPPRVSPSLTSPQDKKLINQRSEGDVLGLLPDQAFSPTDAFDQTPLGGEETFANFAQFENSVINLPGRGRSGFDDGDNQVGPRKHGAFEVYRKPTPRNSDSPELVPSIPDVNDTLKKLQEQNILLSRLCHKLSVELADVQREKETLRLRLEGSTTTV